MIDLETRSLASKLFTVGLTGTTCNVDPAMVRTQFERDHYFDVLEPLDPAFLAKLMLLSTDSRFEPIQGSQIEAETPQRVSRLLDVAIGRDTLLRWVECATGCEPLVGFRGRLTQARAGTGGRRVWHDDLDESDKRRIALVINLSPAAFSGGSFELRHKSGEPILTQRYAAPGEALLFRVDPTLEHRVLPVLTGGPRRVFAGWFVSE